MHTQGHEPGGYTAKSLHEIIDNLIDTLSEAVDPETGEINAAFDAALDALNLELGQKVDAYAAVYRRLTGEADALRDFAKRYTAIAKTRENQAERLRERMRQELLRAGTNKAKGKMSSATIQPNPISIELVNGEKLPDEYAIITRTADKKKILADLQAGKQLPFAELHESNHLRFR